MSNFSSIGFAVQTEEEFHTLVRFCFDKGQIRPCSDGAYIIYSDKSGAELYGQLNRQNEVLGMNPHFNGKSKRKVCITAAYSSPESELDGSFHCWANPEIENDPDSGDYPFVFDVPNYKAIKEIDYPKDFIVQLSAFAQEIDVYDDEQEFSDKQNPIGDGEKDLKFAAQSFIPSGLFNEDENSLPQATGFFAGIIKEWKLLTNGKTRESFYWILVETLGGEVDVVVDPKLTSKEPKVGGVAQGVFWLSGKLIDPPFQDHIVETKKKIVLAKTLWLTDPQKKIFSLEKSIKQKAILEVLVGYTVTLPNNHYVQSHQSTRNPFLLWLNSIDELNFLWISVRKTGYRQILYCWY